MKFFNQFTFQTPESVELEFTLAGIGNRAYALLIDYLVLGLTLIVFLILWATLFFVLRDVFDDFGLSDRALGLWFLAIQILIAFAIYVGYFVFFESLWQGQTPGKRFVKIRVIRDDGRPVGLQQSTLRALVRPIDDIFFLGTFLIAFGKWEKRLGDWFAGTIVIQEEHSVRADNIAITEPARDLAVQLRIEGDFSRLKSENFAIVREYLRRREVMLLKAKHELSRKLADRVKDIIGLDDIPPDVTADLFLEAVYLAYQERSPLE